MRINFETYNNKELENFIVLCFKHSKEDNGDLYQEAMGELKRRCGFNYASMFIEALEEANKLFERVV